jgi:hypothetical protein
MKRQSRLENNENRGVFIDNIQGWFSKRNMFWTAITFIALAAIIILQLSFTFLTGINPHIRLLIYPILVPLLLLFIFSIFWRNTITAFLSLAGALCLFVGMYYAYLSRYEVVQTISSSASQAGNIGMQFPPLDAVATFYFFMGLFSAFLCIGIAFKPSFFRAKGAVIGLPYPIWSIEHDLDSKHTSSSNRVNSLIHIQSLLNFGERHLISNYKYIQVMIGGKIYFVSLNEWVPQSSTYVIRDKVSGSLIGIPKVSDGFNIR